MWPASMVQQLFPLLPEGYPLIVGQPLPTLPLWLTEDLMVPLDLEASYEAACRVLHIS